MLIGRLLIAGLLLGHAGARAAPPAIDAYLLMGQSNMSGRGALAELTADERRSDPAIRLFGNDGQWRDAVEPIDSAAGQIDTVSADDKIAAVGPALFFARALASAARRPIALIPCAKGGSSLREWAPAEGGGSLYGSCLARARGSGARIAGILWYQGETDARDPQAAAWWPRAFMAMLTRLRRDLHAPKLPTIIVSLADPPASDGDRYPGWSALQTAQGAMAGACLGHASAAGLPLAADFLHLTTASQRVLGRRLAAAMSRLRGCRG